MARVTFYFDALAAAQTLKNWQRLVDGAVAGLEIRNQPHLERVRQGTSLLFSFDFDALNERFEKPALNLTGRQDSLEGYKDLGNLLNNYPRVSFAVLDRSGHALQIEEGRLFNALVHEWRDGQTQGRSMRLCLRPAGVPRRMD